MTSLRLTEFPNAEIVEKISRHKMIDPPEQRDMYHAYLKSIKDGKSVIQYKGKKQDNQVLGRLYSATPYMLSSCNMWNRARATLFKDTEYDIDMINAHFKLLLAMCKRYRENFPPETYEILEKYCEDRDSIFEDIYVNEMIIDEYNLNNNEAKTKKDFLKTLFTIKLYGGSVRTWENTYGLNDDDYELSEVFTALENELTYIAKTIVKIHPKSDLAMKMYVEKVKKKMKHKYYDEKEVGDIKIKTPSPHKLLAYLLQDKEREVVCSAIKKAQKAGFTVTCYSYDGFQVLKNDGIHDFLSTINDIDEGVEFVVKPFRDPLPLDDKYLIEPEPDCFDALTMWRIGLKQTFDEDVNKYILKPSTTLDLKKKKEYFDKYFMFVSNQKKIVQELSCGIFNFIAPNDTKYFANVEYVNEKGDKSPFINWWLKQLDRREYEKMECLPPPCETPKNVYNLWKGFEIEETELDDSADVSVIMDHFYNVAGCDEKVRDYLLDWFAHKIQKPAIKTEVCLILYTDGEGAGKGIFSECLMKTMLGKYHKDYFQTIKKMCEIGTRFSNVAEKLLAVHNETKAQATYGLIDQIKDFITEQTFNKELKGANIEVGLRALCDMILTTNNDNCMKISQSDRRFAIIECNEDNIGNQEYFKKVWFAFNDKKIVRKFYQLLKDRDISNFFAQADRPITKIYEEFKKSSMSAIDLFWAERYIKWKDCDGDKIDKPKISYMWDCFQRFHEKNFPKNQHYYTLFTFSKASRKIKGIYKDAQTVKVDGETQKCFVIEYDELEGLYNKSL